MLNKVLIIGGTGQIGFYLARLLIKKKIKVYISTRNNSKKKNITIKKKI